MTYQNCRNRRILLCLVFGYLLFGGATFNGLLFPEIRLINLVLMMALVIFWVAARFRQGWQWYGTGMSGLWIGWLLVFAVSMIANPEVWRRSLIGLWYMGFYLGVWIILVDVMMNRAVAGESLVDGLYVVGLGILIYGYLQLGIDALLPEFDGVLLRPTSALGNPNSLASFLLILFPFACLKFFRSRSISDRVLNAIYINLILGLLFLTFSRGGWVALTGASLAGIILIFKTNDRIQARIKNLYIQFGVETRGFRLIALFFFLIFASGIVVGIFLFIDSFSIPGRTLDLRIVVWKSAIAQFLKQPLTGQGLFAFGRDLPLSASIPPWQPHSHAHNLPLHILAELGLPGAFMLMVAAIVFVHKVRRNWRHAESKGILPASVIAVIGVAIHHLFDMTVMMPALLLLTMMILVLLLTSGESIRIMKQKRLNILAQYGVIVLWCVLFITGFWSNSVYARYIDVLREVSDSGHYAEAAQKMSVIIDADPAMPVYRLQQAYLWGLAADQDIQFSDQAVVAYRAFLEMEPYHAVSWANLAALHWQIGNPQNAVESMKRAAQLAPDSDLFTYMLAFYQHKEADIPEEESFLFERGINYARAEFLRDALPGQFLPQLVNGIPRSNILWSNFE